MQVVVGRVGRAHGIRGEVDGRGPHRRARAPASRSAPSCITDPASVGPLTVANGRVHSGRLLLRFDGVDDRTPPRRCAAPCCSSRSTRSELPEDADEWYDHQLVGLAAVTPDGDAARHGHRGRPPARRRTCWPSARRTTARSWCRSSPRSSPRSTCWPAGSSSTRRRACSRTSTSGRPADATRADVAACGSTSSRSSPTTSRRSGCRSSARRRGRPARRPRPRPARATPRPAPHGRRHARTAAAPAW